MLRLENLPGKHRIDAVFEHHLAYVSTRQHTSAQVSIRQNTSAYASIRQHTPAYLSICQYTSAKNIACLAAQQRLNSAYLRELCGLELLAYAHNDVC